MPKHMNRLHKIKFRFSSKTQQQKLRLQHLGYRLLTQDNSYLVEKAFAESILKNEIGESEKDARPWINYPLMDFIEERLTKQMNVFEYGSGLSTLYFARRVKSIVSIEHNKDWFERVRSLIRNNKNATVIYVELNYEYPEAIRLAGIDKKYDLVLVDGRMRNKCVENAVDLLSPTGVIILDDSERPRYQPGFVLLESMGFKQISIAGMKPGMIRKSRGTIFYKSGNNCFNI
jgi:SAM-dependent methyltransferase